MDKKQIVKCPICGGTMENGPSLKKITGDLRHLSAEGLKDEKIQELIRMAYEAGMCRMFIILKSEEASNAE